MSENSACTSEGEQKPTGASDGHGEGLGLAGLFTDGSRSAELLMWADENGAERPAILLAAQLARGLSYAPHLESQGQSEFIDKILAAVAGGRLRDNAARRWLLWLWDEAPESLRSRFADHHTLSGAECVIDMHRRTIAGEPFSASEWREARKRFRATASAEGPAPAVEAVLSSMWDLKTIPGAIADVASTWVTESTLTDAIEQVGWSWSEYDRTQSAWDAFAIEFARLARAPDEDESEYNARKQAYMRDNPPKLSEDDFARRKSMEEARTKIAEQRVTELRHGFVKIALTG